jgi:sugar O-acyltransferase (sialic acid O-acetyltransferase NeuD family)
MEKLLIFPFNGNGLEAVDCIQGQFELIGFIDDTPEKQGKTKFGFEVFGKEVFEKYKEAKILAVPGSPTSFMCRHEIIRGLHVSKDRFATVIHPQASVSPMAQIGKNVLLMAGVVVTSNAIISDHVCILPNSVIHHDSIIGEWTLIGCNVAIAGHVAVGKNCYIGSGSNIINGIEIGNGSLLGMGTTLIKSIPANSKVVGNPARSIL